MPHIAINHLSKQPWFRDRKCVCCCSYRLWRRRGCCRRWWRDAAGAAAADRLPAGPLRGPPTPPGLLTAGNILYPQTGEDYRLNDLCGSDLWNHRFWPPNPHSHFKLHIIFRCEVCGTTWSMTFCRFLMEYCGSDFVSYNSLVSNGTKTKNCELPHSYWIIFPKFLNLPRVLDMCIFYIVMDSTNCINLRL